MPNATFHARVTAVSMAHGAALVRLLRAHGELGHADNLEAALGEVFRIVSADLGPEALTEAMRWVTEQTDDEAPPPGHRH